MLLVGLFVGALPPHPRQGYAALHPQCYSSIYNALSN